MKLAIFYSVVGILFFSNCQRSMFDSFRVPVDSISVDNENSLGITGLKNSKEQKFFNRKIEDIEIRNDSITVLQINDNHETVITSYVFIHKKLSWIWVNNTIETFIYKVENDKAFFYGIGMSRF